MWDVYQDNQAINGCGSGENTCWLNVNRNEDGELFDRVMELLNRDKTNINNVKILIIASQIDK